MTTPHLVLVAITGVFLANAQMPADATLLAPLIQVPIGAVLAWFMVRAEKKLDEQNRIHRAQVSATERATYAQMVAIMGMEHMDTNIKGMARTIADQAKIAEEKNDADGGPR